MDMDVDALSQAAVDAAIEAAAIEFAGLANMAFAEFYRESDALESPFGHRFPAVPDSPAIADLAEFVHWLRLVYDFCQTNMYECVDTVWAAWQAAGRYKTIVRVAPW